MAVLLQQSTLCEINHQDNEVKVSLKRGGRAGLTDSILFNENGGVKCFVGIDSSMNTDLDPMFCFVYFKLKTNAKGTLESTVANTDGHFIWKQLLITPCTNTCY